MRAFVHLPVDISRGSKFLLDFGAEAIVELIQTHYRRSKVIGDSLHSSSKNEWLLC